MDEATGYHGLREGVEPIDHYLLAFWPAPSAPDRIVRRTSRAADYWHDQGFRRRT